MRKKNWGRGLTHCPNIGEPSRLAPEFGWHLRDRDNREIPVRLNKWSGELIIKEVSMGIKTGRLKDDKYGELRVIRIA